MNSFRLRSAYGASGVQPGGTVSLQTFSASTSNIATTPGAAGGADTPGLIANALGNPDLKPERSTEFEGGFETSVFSNRLHIDAHVLQQEDEGRADQPADRGVVGHSALSVLEQPRSVANSGYELTVNATLLDRRALGWDITVAASHNSNKILSLGIDASGQAAADDRHGHDARLGRRCRSTATSPARSRTPTRTATASSRPNEVTGAAPNFAVRRLLAAARHRVDHERLRSVQPQLRHHGAHRLQGRLQPVQQLGAVLLARTSRPGIRRT